MPFSDLFGSFDEAVRPDKELRAADAVIVLNRCSRLGRGATTHRRKPVASTRARLWTASSFCVAQPVVSHHRNPEAVSFPPPSMFRRGALCNDFVCQSARAKPSARTPR